MDQLLRDVMFGVRLLVRRPGFTLIAVVTLALGIGAVSAIFGVLNAMILRPLPFPEAERLAILWETRSDASTSNTSFTTVGDWRAQATGFDEIAAFRTWKPTLLGEGDPERIPAMRVSHQFFPLLGIEPALGRTFLPEEDRPDTWRVVVLGNEIWTRRFGADPGIVGRSITLDGEPFTVVGVMPAAFEPVLSEHFYERAEIWSPLGYDASLPNACRTCRHIKAIGRLAPGVSIEPARAELSAITSRLEQEHPRSYPATDVAVVPLAEEISGPRLPALYLLFAAVLCVLFIACANVGNLIIVQATRRQRELAIRASLGGGRLRILRQLTTESLLLSAVGAAIGLGLASWATDLIVWLAPPGVFEGHQIPRLDLRVAAFVTSLSVVTGLAFGLLPSAQIWRLDLFATLRKADRGIAGPASGRLRSLLVVSQIALALLLLVGASLLLRSLARLIDVDPGFNPRGVLTMEVFASGSQIETDEDVWRNYEQVLEKIRALPGVESAAVGSQVPFGGNFDGCGIYLPEWIDPDPADVPDAQRFGVSHGYFETMGIRILAGRAVTAADGPGAQPVAVVGESLARKLWPGDDPIGKRLRVAGESPTNPWRTVVGVAADVHHRDLSVEPPLQAYIPHSQFSAASVNVVVRAGGSLEGLVEPVRRAIWSVNSTQSIAGVSTMEERVTRSLAERRFVLFLLGLFATVAVALAAIGLYGTVAYAVAMRTHEIGVRVALGAKPGDVLTLVLRSGVRLALLGLGLGFLASCGASRLLSGMLFGVGAADPAAFALAPLLLLGVVLAACYLPARRATRIDPAEALRYE
jgi:putative ABC transport system permease protein